MAQSHTVKRVAVVSVAVLAGIGLSMAAAAPVNAVTVINGPIDLGSAAGFGVLGASTVTNTGPSTIGADVGVSPGTEITGFPPGLVFGATHQTDAVAAEAQSDLTIAYNVAAGLTPTTTGLDDLAGQSLAPGVYSGGDLSLTGELTLAGTAESVWVFQAASTLTAGSSARITLTGGASACNVFWQVGSSATLGSGSQFAGTILARASITAVTGAAITGRLLADTGAVTLDTNVVTAPVACSDASGSVVSTSPAVSSSAPPAAEVGTDYAFAVTATGTPAPTYAISAGSLPAGLQLNGTSGMISGTPTTAGSSTFTITVSNGTAPDAVITFTVVTAQAAEAVTPDAPTPPAPASAVTSVPTPDIVTGEILPVTGADPTVPLLGGATLLALGLSAVLWRSRAIRSR
ncbi:ice-binding family protein [Salinibacterium sp. ZJ450]|uniref:ice-binding family protein n=1 Tax=Salinibacterium sp. ZJ450 TaxID=2708338 RepID=UPI001421B38F|nr:ice-binding family protein [Salinibacterium sp. ZJ450]